MPREMRFKAGAVIYFLGDEAESVYLLKGGAVNLVYLDMETGEDQHDAVGAGEFIGVASALGKYRREENAAASLDSVVMVFTPQEFEDLAMTNSRIMMTMLRVFSRRLRTVHKKVADLTKSSEKSPEEGLFHLGEFYLKNRRYAQARYVFGRYLVYYPSGRYADPAGRCLEKAEELAASSPPPRENRPAPPPKSASPQAAAPKAASPQAAQTAPGSSRAYYDALSLMSQGKYQAASQAFKDMVDAGPGDDEYVLKSCFDMGRCFFFMGQFEDCIGFYTKMLRRYPRHPSTGDALYYIGQSHEGQNHRELAGGYYRKALALVGEGGLRSRIQQALDAWERR